MVNPKPKTPNPGSSKPIGIFDSGVGGLTVFKALRKRLPQEGLIYFGDTAHLPYGSKSGEAVTKASLQVARFLSSQDIKLLVVACNTASALALPALKKALAVPILGVVQPGVRAAVRLTQRKKMGIIGTEGTIASGVYQQALVELLPDAKVWGVPCPLFVPLVEEGWWNHSVTIQVAAEYLSPLKKAGVDTLVLGCTHYPLLARALARFMGPRVVLVDSAEATAIEVEQLLTGMGLLQKRGVGRQVFYASDGPERFLKMAKRFLGEHIEKVEIIRFE